mmetsp:Transcript_45426/g.33203  ORF Transcript_45426/g.33203 Transcript_45426/m.33203 type:complete len:91 (+) Transcript_45426:240-512(+)
MGNTVCEIFYAENGRLLVFHHFTVILAAFVTMYNHYGGFEFAVTLFFADFSSLFLALRGILLGIGGKKWKITKIVELSFGLSFLAIRLFC